MNVCVLNAETHQVQKKVAPLAAQKIVVDTTLVLEDDNAVERYLASMFEDKELEKKISIRSKPSHITDIVELIGLSSGIDFVIDPDVEGSIGKINFDKKTTGEVLKLLCARNAPRLAVFKQCGIWRIVVYDKIAQILKSAYREPVSQHVFSLKNVDCNDTLKTKIEDMWQQVVKQQRHEQAYCTVDKESKKIFFNATDKQWTTMQSFLKEIDCTVAQVRIDAIVAIIDRKYEHQLGFNWTGIYNRAISSDRSFDFLGIGGKSHDSGADTFALNLFSKAAQAVKIPFVFGGHDLNLQRITMELRAAENESKAKILLKPSVLTSHNETAEILIGSIIPIKTTVDDSGGKGKSVQAINYKEIGTRLNVRPFVNPDRKSVLLELWVEDSSIAGAMIDTNTPIIKTIRTKNKVTLRSKQTTVIGGLMLNRHETTGGQVPILGSIPLLGGLFRSKNHTKEDNQMLIFITPTIVS